MFRDEYGRVNNHRRVNDTKTNEYHSKVLLNGEKCICVYNIYIHKGYKGDQKSYVFEGMNLLRESVCKS